MTDFNENVCLCALNRLLGNVPLAGKALIEHYGCAKAVFDASQDEMRHLLGSLAGGRAEPETRMDLAACIGPRALEESAAELDKLARMGGRFIGYEDEDYPSMLRECPDCPIGIYVRSGGPVTGIFEMKPCVAVVGTRDISPYGKEWCVRLVRAMATTKRPPVIVSGLAYGADAVAHATALECGMGTVAVMATGMDDIYPFSHRDLSERIVADPCGALLTDYPFGSSPVALNFVRRNRIIAGLSIATIVIESKQKGGSLLTAKYAVDYNRDVYALPGRIDDYRSAGCNSLIDRGMASIIASPDELVEKLGLGGMKTRIREDLEGVLIRKYGSGSAPARIGMLIKQNRGASYDALAAMSGLSWSEVSGAAGVLESDGIITTDFLQRCSIKP